MSSAGICPSRACRGPAPPRRYAGRRAGFTLTELLVVVSILLVLAAVLIPVVASAIESARRSTCRSNLHQFGIGLRMYQNNYNGRVMRIVNWTGTIYPYPGYIRYDNTADPSFAGEWAINQIKPYVESFSTSNGANENVYGVAICPSVNVKLINKYIQARNIANPSWRFIEYPYSYWGGVDTVKSQFVKGTALTDLAKTFPNNNEILMSDVLYFDASDFSAGGRGGVGFWRYNHGPDGWAFNEVDWLPKDMGTTPNVSGTNRLFTDGSVRWKPASEYLHLNLMSQPSAYPDGCISVGGGDTYYY